MESAAQCPAPNSFGDGRCVPRTPDLHVVKVADAAQDNWQSVSRKVRVGKEVVDYFHATEHLSEGQKAVYVEGTGEHRRRFMIHLAIFF